LEIELKKKIGGATTDELLRLPTTSLKVVIAARLESDAKQKNVPEDERTQGLFIWLIRDPRRITDKFLERSARLIRANPALDGDSGMPLEMAALLAGKIQEARNV
jgi:hypothetical protein